MTGTDNIAKTPGQGCFFSVIVAVFNGEKTMPRCLASVFDQTYPHKELIIIDGGSTDHTVDLLQAGNDRIAHWESEPDRGICHAWNKALAHARGRWVCFLGADDYFWRENVLAAIAEQLAALPDHINVAYGQVAHVDEQGAVLQIMGQPWEKVRKRFLQQMSIPHQAVFHRRVLFEEHGKFDESFRIAGDYEFLLRELKTADARFLKDIVVAGVQRGGLSNTRENFVQSLREYAQARRKNRVTVFPGRWAWSYAKAWMHIALIRFFGDKGSRYIADGYRKLTSQPPYWTR
jgi:glycosyltransferase involved in cell wall biosynthesis